MASGAEDEEGLSGVAPGETDLSGAAPGETDLSGVALGGVGWNCGWRAKSLPHNRIGTVLRQGLRIGSMRRHRRDSNNGRAAESWTMKSFNHGIVPTPFMLRQKINQVNRFPKNAPQHLIPNQAPKSESSGVKSPFLKLYLTHLG